MTEAASPRELYRNARTTVREDVVRRLDGSEGIYGVVDKPDLAGEFATLAADTNGVLDREG